MKRLIAYLGMFLIVAQYGYSQRIAFVHGSDVFTGDVHTGVFQKLARLGGNAAKGDDLQLCADGHRVAYTFTVNLKRAADPGRPDFERYIEIANIDGTGRSRLLNTPERNAFGPLWSPDFRSVAFQCLYPMPDSRLLQWRITTAGETLKKSMPLMSPVLERGFFVFTWTPQGELVILGNDTLNIFSPDGSRTGFERLSLDTLEGTEFSPSSSDILSLSPDGRSMVWILTGADEGSKNFAGIYEEDLYGIMMVYDRTAKTLRRISPKTMAVTFEPPCWTSDGKSVIFCGIQAAKPLRKGAHPSTDLFQIGLDGSGLKRIAANAHAPVVLR